MKKGRLLVKVLFAASEAVPFFASGGLADVAGSLPNELCRLGHDVRVVLPFYKDVIKPEIVEKMTFVADYTVKLSWRELYCGLFTLEHDGVTYYFIDNEFYFARVGLYGYGDDPERFAFFSKAILESLKYMSFKPQIIHANDWQTALISVYYRLEYRKRPGYSNIKHMLTVHNINYQGIMPIESSEDLFGISFFDNELVKYDNQFNMLKAGMEASQLITTVSPSYAKEILEPYFSAGLHNYLKERDYKIVGILNGIDYKKNDPETDENIYANYSVKDLKGKAVNKKELVESFNMDYHADVPVIGMVSRLVKHKGFDLLEADFEGILRTGAQLIILGSGEQNYENFLRYMSHKYPNQVGLMLGFIPELAMKIYAGADMFLMPSSTEPCGLAQMIALRYGTIPIVRSTGGLKDSIIDYSKENANGFSFEEYSTIQMVGTICRAVDLFKEPKKWRELAERAMKCDFSWTHSANEYIDVYKKLLTL